ncbi:hypothetical protein NLJ89_g6124 [Agrocybe chaxingu]|uniref:DUF2415 domain-containing protein n=1 Tax=Agrocybe chaxingu TaxID=84603 RepID=A0A9W8K717_9AGAR|nr:hypothetical protein NLJ89_g6124 [Agrocybe chaxingu]
MARDPTLLSEPQPTAIAPARPTIAHVQLRDLLICPREQGVVNYVTQRVIVEQDLHAPGAPTRILAHLHFTPNSLTSLPVGQNDTLIAAGGQEAEIHLSYHTPSSSRRTHLVWDHEEHLAGSINNSVLLTSLSLTTSNESSIEPRVGVSNNDGSVRLYDVPLRLPESRRKLAEVGAVRLDVPINHSSISPDGRTLLSVGDSNKVYFHRIAGGGRITFSPITTLSIPPPDPSPLLSFPTSSLAASFSTAFSGDGSKFAVASQEGVVAVWDVRSTKVMKVFQTDKMRGLGGGMERTSMGNGGGSGWLSDDPWEWTRGTKAPGWCVRSVKFNGGEGGRMGKEVMAFTEVSFIRFVRIQQVNVVSQHTSLVHIVDARTFETHDIIRVPTMHKPPPRQQDHPHRLSRPRLSSAPSRTSSPNANANADTGATSSSGSASTSAPASSTQQRRTQRNTLRRLMPVSNARRTASSAAANTPSSNNATTSGSATNPNAASPPLSASSSLSETTQAMYELFRDAPARNRPPRRRLARPEASSSNASGSNFRHERILAGNSSSANAGLSSRPEIVRALGDAFRIPTSAYSAPASIGDSTWRTLGGTNVVGNVGIGVGSGFGIGRGALDDFRAAAVGSSSDNANPSSGRTSPRPVTNPTSRASNTERGMPSLLEWAEYVLDLENAEAMASLNNDFAAAAAGATSSTIPDPASASNPNPLSLDVDGARDPEEDAALALARRVRRAEQAAGLHAHDDEGPMEENGLESLLQRIRTQGRARARAWENRSRRDPAEVDAETEARVRDLEQIMRERERELEEEGIVVVPDLGDRFVENEVHALLAVHGIESRLSSDGPAEGAAGHAEAGAGATTRRRRRELDDEGDDLDEEDRAMRYGFIPPGVTDDEELDEDEEADRDTNTGSTTADYEYRLYGTPRYAARTRRFARRMRDFEGGFDEAEEDIGLDLAELEADAEDRMDVDVHGDEEGDVDIDVDRDGEADQDVDIDEEDDNGDDDAECSSSAGNSRAPSPGLLSSGSRIRNGFIPNVSSSLRFGANAASSTGSSSSSSGSSTIGRRRTRSSGSAREEPKYDYPPSTSASGGRRKPNGLRCKGGRHGYFYYDDLDIAGLCFDPWGERMYVAGVAAAAHGVGSAHGGLFSGAFGGAPPVGAPGGAGQGEGVGAVVECDAEISEIVDILRVQAVELKSLDAQVAEAHKCYVDLLQQQKSLSAEIRRVRALLSPEDEDDGKAIIDTFLHFSSRWKKLELTSPSAYLKSISAMVDVPVLESIAIDEGRSFANGVHSKQWEQSPLLKAPNLREVSVCKLFFDQPHLLPLRWSQLTSLSVNGFKRGFGAKVNEVFRALQPCIQLLSLRLVLPRKYNSGVDDGTDEGTPSWSLLLPALRDLTIQDGGRDLTSFFRRLEAPNLRYLEYMSVKSGARPLEAFGSLLLPPFLSRTPFLTALTLDPEGFTRETLLETLQQCPVLISLSFREWEGTDDTWQSYNDPLDPGNRIVDDDFLNFFVSNSSEQSYLCPELEDFHCRYRASFTDQGLIGFIKRKQDGSVSRVAKLKRVRVDFTRGSTCSIIAEEAKRFVEEGLTLQTSHRGPSWTPTKYFSAMEGIPNPE